MDATSESEAHLIDMGETMLDHEYLPVEEMLAYEEFTDFGKSGEIEVPLFQFVNSKTVKGAKTPQYQIDVYGKERGKDERVWLCECKYTKTKMGLKQVEKLEQAAEALKQEAAEAGRSIPEIRFWLVSTGGFTQEVLDYVSGREDVYTSYYEGINRIFQAYGGNYRIPIFREAERSETP